MRGSHSAPSLRSVPKGGPAGARMMFGNLNLYAALKGRSSTQRCARACGRAECSEVTSLYAALRGRSFTKTKGGFCARGPHSAPSLRSIPQGRLCGARKMFGNLTFTRS